MKKSVLFFFFLKHWIEVKSIDRDPRWYTRRVKEAISQHFTLTKSTGTVEWKFLKRGCPRPKKTTTGELHDNGPSREQLTLCFLFWKIFGRKEILWMYIYV